MRRRIPIRRQVAVLRRWRATWRSVVLLAFTIATVLPVEGHALQRHVLSCSSRPVIRTISVHHARVLRLHGPLSEVLGRGAVESLLSDLPPLLEVQAGTNEDDHQRCDDDEADDGAVVAGEVEAEDAVD